MEQVLLMMTQTGITSYATWITKYLDLPPSLKKSEMVGDKQLEFMGLIATHTVCFYPNLSYFLRTKD